MSRMEHHDKDNDPRQGTAMSVGQGEPQAPYHTGSEIAPLDHVRKYWLGW